MPAPKWSWHNTNTCCRDLKDCGPTWSAKKGNWNARSGETEIETDRRIVRDKITLLKKKLTIIDKQMATQRGNRGALVRVALVGYTNVGNQP